MRTEPVATSSSARCCGWPCSCIVGSGGSSARPFDFGARSFESGGGGCSALARPRSRSGGAGRGIARQLRRRLVHLHVDLPHHGAGQLAMLARRVLGLVTTRETVRRILLRRQALVVELEEAKQRRRRRIQVKRRLELWGADFTLVWVLGFFPVWLLGVIDYQGSRLVAFERVARPDTAALVRVVSAAIATHGTPSRLLTDNGGPFVSKDFAAFLAQRGVAHSFIRPGHAWTNGRIERVFRTFKETVFGFIWLFSATAQVERFAADFLQWHNRDRPHSSWGGRTPDEVWHDRKPLRRARGRVTYFDGHLEWWRFG